MVDIVLKLLHRLNESGLSRASPFKRVLPTLVCGNFSPAFATNSAHLMLVFSLSHRRNQWKVFRWQPRFLFLLRMVLKCYVDWNARGRPRPPTITSRFAHNQERTTTPCSCGPQGLQDAPHLWYPQLQRHKRIYKVSHPKSWSVTEWLEGFANTLNLNRMISLRSQQSHFTCISKTTVELYLKNSGDSEWPEQRFQKGRTKNKLTTLLPPKGRWPPGTRHGYFPVEEVDASSNQTCILQAIQIIPPCPLPCRHVHKHNLNYDLVL